MLRPSDHDPNGALNCKPQAKKAPRFKRRVPEAEAEGRSEPLSPPPNPKPPDTLDARLTPAFMPSTARLGRA